MTYHQLTQEERYLITAQRMCGRSATQIARALGRHRSTIGRELMRNATPHDGRYRSVRAQERAEARRKRTRRHPQYSASELARVNELLRA